MPLAGLLLLVGCAAPAESPDEIAERYARQETELIDQQAFEQARERSRMQRDARSRTMIESAAPLDIDPALADRWQFGTLVHPLSGESVCAALSGLGEPAAAPGEPTPRLLVLADGAWVTSTTPLAPDRIESAVRIDSGLPMPLDVSADGRLAALAVSHQALLERLRAGSVATLRVMIASSTSGGNTSTGDTDASPVDGDAALGGASRAIERVIDLDRLPPMLDELERCAAAGVS